MKRFGENLYILLRRFPLFISSRISFHSRKSIGSKGPAYDLQGLKTKSYVSLYILSSFSHLLSLTLPPSPFAGANRVRSSTSAAIDHFEIHQGTHILQVSSLSKRARSRVRYTFEWLRVGGFTYEIISPTSGFQFTTAMARATVLHSRVFQNPFNRRSVEYERVSRNVFIQITRKS